MNWFVNLVCKWGFLAVMMVFWGAVIPGKVNGQPLLKSVQRPVPALEGNGLIYADLDTAGNRVLLVLSEGLWSYDLPSGEWAFRDSLKPLSDKLDRYEFGFNAKKRRLQFWSRGVGHFYEANSEGKGLIQKDNSVEHLNQLGHVAFFRGDTLYTFGGYGFWRWENILTYFNERIGEWNLQNVAEDSEFPSPRVPLTGVYVPGRELFLTWGGNSPEEGRPDDQITQKVFRRDIWGYSFPTQTWSLYGNLPESDFDFYHPGKDTPASGRVNSISSSFYDPASDFWFIPVHRPDRFEDLVYLQPVKPESDTHYLPIPLELEDVNHFRPIHFLFDASEGNVVVVGVNKLNHSKHHPILVTQVPVATLTSQLQKSRRLIDMLPASMLGGFALVLFGAFIWWARERLSGNEGKQIGRLPVTVPQLIRAGRFTRKEKKLIEELHNQNEMLESHELEELLWPNTKNYDYRRRLRNDLIKAINTKFENEFGSKELIQRNKDPEDKRKFLYGLNRVHIRD